MFSKFGKDSLEDVREDPVPTFGAAKSTINNVSVVFANKEQFMVTRFVPERLTIFGGKDDAVMRVFRPPSAIFRRLSH